MKCVSDRKWDRPLYNMSIISLKFLGTFTAQLFCALPILMASLASYVRLDSFQSKDGPTNLVSFWRVYMVETLGTTSISICFLHILMEFSVSFLMAAIVFYLQIM